MNEASYVFSWQFPGDVQHCAWPIAQGRQRFVEFITVCTIDVIRSSANV